VSGDVGLAPGTAYAPALLLSIFRSQAYRELGAVRLFEAGLALAPDLSARRELTGHARDERAHLDGVLSLWCGRTGRPRDELLAECQARLDARPLPAPSTWLDLAMARLLYDRAGHWQLREYLACSFAPYAALVRAIVAEEAAHEDAGARAVLALVGPAVRAEAQAAFERWLRPALLSFGRPGSAASLEAIRLGLKARMPEQVLHDFVADVHPIARAVGLTWPPARGLGLELPEGLLPSA
jgi:1,2-phenylacetyl-CoA epoxidase catalytic subunit